jgi:Calcium-dependent channel, 7TM region, putative phosphate
MLPPIVFIFMIAILYMPIVPIMSFFTWIYFFGNYTVYKHQCLHVYAQGDENESGGVTTFQTVYQFIVICLYMSECVFIAYMLIKGAPIIALLGFIPLIITILVNRELHYTIINPMKYIPMEIAKQLDHTDTKKMKEENNKKNNQQQQQQRNEYNNRNDMNDLILHVYRQPALDITQDERGPMPYRHPLSNHHENDSENDVE